VADDEDPAPAEVIEHGLDVVDRLREGERSHHRRRGQPPLL